MRLPRAPKLLDESELWEYALKTLAARSLVTSELREKLRKKAARKTDVDPILSRLKEMGYLDDKKFAEYFAARRLENEGFGRARVLADLRARRVSPAVAERAVKNAFEGTDEVALIEQFLERKYRRRPLAEVLADSKGLASAYRKLRTAGFSSINSIKVLKRHTRDLETLAAIEASDEEPPSAD